MLEGFFLCATCPITAPFELKVFRKVEMIYIVAGGGIEATERVSIHCI